MPPRSKAPPPPWGDLPADSLVLLAEMLPVPDRHRLNLVCKSWRDALLGAAQLWAAITVDPRRRISSPTRIRFRKNLPTAEALAAWARTYGVHATRLSLANMGAQSAIAGCVDRDQLRSFTEQLAPQLEAVAMSNLDSAHTDAALWALRGASRLGSLRVQVPATYRAEYLDLSLEALPALGCLRELSLEWAPQAEGEEPRPPEEYQPLWIPTRLVALRTLTISCRQAQSITLPPELGALTALRELCLEGRLAVEAEHLAEPEENELEWDRMTQERFAATVCRLRGLTRLELGAVGLGWVGAGWQDPEGLNQPTFRLPEAITQLQALRALSLREHWLQGVEVVQLSGLVRLTSLELSAAAQFFTIPDLVADPAGDVDSYHLPPQLGALTALRTLSLRHNMTKVPAFVANMTGLTRLDLSGNVLRTLRPGRYLSSGLVELRLAMNQLKRLPAALRGARGTLRTLCLHGNFDLELTRDDADLLASFPELRGVEAVGISEARPTQQALARLAHLRPDVLVDA